MNKEFIGLGLAFIGGTALGAGASYFIINKRLVAKYEVILEEENARTKEFYSRLHKTGEYADPVSAADHLVADAADALNEYQGKSETIPGDRVVIENDGVTIEPEPDDEEEVQDVVKRNIWTDLSDDKRIEDQDKSKPYVITEAEWSTNEEDHDHINLTYYAGDNVLCDDADGVIEHVEQIVGVENLTLFGVGSDDPNIVFIRNEKLSSDYEIVRREDKFSVTVLSFDDNQLQHSAEPMPRKRRLRD